MVEFLEGLGLSPQLLIFVISMVPFVELRGGIIVGLALELPWWEVLPICFIGNIFPIPFVILFGRKIIDWLGKTKLFGRFVARYKLKLAEIKDYKEIWAFWAGAVCRHTSTRNRSLVGCASRCTFKYAHCFCCTSNFGGTHNCGNYNDPRNERCNRRFQCGNVKTPAYFYAGVFTLEWLYVNTSFI